MIMMECEEGDHQGRWGRNEVRAMQPGITNNEEIQEMNAEVRRENVEMKTQQRRGRSKYD